MILVERDICKKYHAAFKKARGERIRAVRLNPLLWYAARVEPGHGQYLIRFHEVPEIGGTGKVFIECRDINGEQCKGTWRKKTDERDPICVHICRVIDRSVQYGKRKERIERAA